MDRVITYGGATYYINDAGQLHRTDGPAVIYNRDNVMEWIVNGWIMNGEEEFVFTADITEHELFMLRLKYDNVGNSLNFGLKVEFTIDLIPGLQDALDRQYDKFA